MSKKVKKQKQKQGKQKQEQTVIVNVTTGKRQRAAPVSKPQQLSPSALQNATNIQLLTGLSNLFASQKKPEFTRTLSSEPIVSEPVSNPLKDVIETAKKKTEPVETPSFEPPRIIPEASVEKSIPQAVKKEASLYTSKGTLDKRSKAFKNLPPEEREKLVLEETMNKPTRARKVTKETLIQERDRVTEIIDNHKLHDTTRMVNEPIPKPFQGVSSLNLSEEEED